jgi:hypothetical protein
MGVLVAAPLDLRPEAGFDGASKNWDTRSMKRKKSTAPRKTVGTVIAEKARARCNELTDGQRQQLDEEFMRLFHAGRPALTRRR